MEACGTAHHWGRVMLQGQRLRAQLADPWRKSGATGSQALQGANTGASDPAAKLGAANRRTHRPQQSRGGAGEQTGEDLLGVWCHERRFSGNWHSTKPA